MIIIIINLLLILSIYNELIRLTKLLKTEKKTKIRFITKPILDKYLTDTSSNNIILEDNIYNKMFSNPSPWMLKNGISK
jgi:hypothetical protein